MVRAGIGLDPWLSFSAGDLATGVGIGWVTNIVGFLDAAALDSAAPAPGPRNGANILLVSTSMQATLAVSPAVDGFALQLIVFVAGMVLVTRRIGALHRRRPARVRATGS
ncbi:MAG: hypothetical protein R2692_08940 [Microbacterium sp.]